MESSFNSSSLNQELAEAHDIWLYQPSLALNVLLIALFGASLVANLIQGIWGKTWGFMIAMILGCTSKSDPYVHWVGSPL